eukprot:1723667-Pleurochrysis_carterae.AAC.2
MHTLVCERVFEHARLCEALRATARWRWGRGRARLRHCIHEGWPVDRVLLPFGVGDVVRAVVEECHRLAARWEQE